MPDPFSAETCKWKQLRGVTINVPSRCRKQELPIPRSLDSWSGRDSVRIDGLPPTLEGKWPGPYGAQQVSHVLRSAAEVMHCLLCHIQAIRVTASPVIEGLTCRCVFTVAEQAITDALRTYYWREPCLGLVWTETRRGILLDAEEVSSDNMVLFLPCVGHEKQVREAKGKSVRRRKRERQSPINGPKCYRA